jgi:hypothetical protein
LTLEQYLNKTAGEFAEQHRPELVSESPLGRVYKVPCKGETPDVAKRSIPVYPQEQMDAVMQAQPAQRPEPDPRGHGSLRPLCTICGKPVTLFNLATGDWTCACGASGGTQPKAEPTPAVQAIGDCPCCNGRGYAGTDRCPDCKGTGRILKPRAEPLYQIGDVLGKGQTWGKVTAVSCIDEGNPYEPWQYIMDIHGPFGHPNWSEIDVVLLGRAEQGVTPEAKPASEPLIAVPINLDSPIKCGDEMFDIYKGEIRPGTIFIAGEDHQIHPIATFGDEKEAVEIIREIQRKADARPGEVRPGIERIDTSSGFNVS